MTDNILRFMPVTEDRVDCKLLFKEGGRLSARNALNRAMPLSVLIRVPRRLGASRVCLDILSESGEALIKDITFSWRSLDDGEDVYALRLDKKLLSAALYFLEIKIFTYFKTYYLRRSVGDFYLTVNPDTGSRPQMTLTEFRHELPEKILGGVIYHVFVDRFQRGGRSGDKAGASFPEGEWEHIPEYPAYPGAPVKNNTFYRGTLDGIRSRLSYLKELGVSVLYLSPVFESASNHRYDTADYMRVDPLLGGDEALSDLMREAARMGIMTVLDGVFNHTGADSIYFNRYGNYGEEGAYRRKDSPYYPWYDFKSYPDSYTCWWDIEILPRINPDVKECGEYFVGGGGVIEKYRKMGAYGFRLDVADELSDEFIAKIKSKLSEDGESYLIGEVWEDASNKIAYGKRKKYYLGEELDGVMNYPLRRGIIDYLTGKGIENLKYALTELYDNTPERILQCEMNLIGSHDTTRIINELSGVVYQGLDNRALSEKRLTEQERNWGRSRLLCAYTILATLPGLPSIYYGDEAGLEGFSDPFNRLPYPLGREDEVILGHYRRVGKIRGGSAVYRLGDFKLHTLTDGLLIFERSYQRSRMITVVNNSDDEIVLFGRFESLISKGNTVRPHSADIVKPIGNTRLTISKRTEK